MGAIHSLDLTSDVTHLIVGRIDTPKYAYVARERPDIHVLHADFLSAVKEKWMAGEDVRELLPALEVHFKLPTFFGLRICVTGFSDFDERARLAETVQLLGGVYCGDLTKEVTHLVCKEPRGKKYEFAVQWRQKVVGPEWVWMSLERGMVLEEGLFLPTMRVEERGVGAIKVVEVEEKVELGKRGRGDEGDGTGRRKMRRVATDTLSGRTENMWADIGGRHGNGNAGEALSEDTTLVEEILPGAMPESNGRKSLFEVDALKGFSGKFIVYGFDQRKVSMISHGNQTKCL
jgi:DNA replication regulator DPB11